ncbi:hypothetical protein SAICODRAFT_204189 [Saitoella complicata NRRL Y-17804]|uniref:uncharacterized protein n=1 Tax=Saitoella complicata (strain BCRC 22490 / CBS 7301 / JCM 7358 / NBRC 10748 / NRRL Y-17804) TaxID=698492 RepID=UPI0008681939|nr:uncharacterized protein SAICODRAFT_204189 [Saitoella complicata NRRL Y-17804]ODQ54731.1 hypothetical protein SAICODRAFT_204189 [Saitoella complicata NRRL Y-17804]
MSNQAATGAIGFTDPNDIDFGNLNSQDRERYSNHFGQDRFRQAEQYWHSRRGTQYQGDNFGSTSTGTSAADAGIGQGLGASPSAFGRPSQGGSSAFGSGQGVQGGQGLRQGEYDTQRAGGSLGQTGQQNLGGRTSADSGYPASSSYQGQGQDSRTRLRLTLRYRYLSFREE